MCDADQWNKKECFLFGIVHWDRGIMVYNYSPMLVVTFIIDDLLNDNFTSEYIIYV